eukprot:201514-Rhodomonas_salina.3
MREILHVALRQLPDLFDGTWDCWQPILIDRFHVDAPPVCVCHSWSGRPRIQQHVSESAIARPAMRMSLRSLIPAAVPLDWCMPAEHQRTRQLRHSFAILPACVPKFPVSHRAERIPVGQYSVYSISMQ